MPQTIDGKLCYGLEDREVRRLIEMTTAQVQFSSTGNSVLFFLPGRDTFFSERSDTVTVNHLDMPAPGLYFSERKAIEPQALFMALGLRAFDEPDGVRLQPVVTSIAPEPSAKPVSAGAPREVAPLLLKFAAAVKPVVLPAPESDPNLLAIQIPDFAWDDELCPRKLHLPEAEIEVVGGDKPGQTLTLRCRLRPFWSGKIQVDLSGTAHLTFSPTHLSGMPKTPATLQGVEVLGSATQEQQIKFLLDKPSQFSWSVEPGASPEADSKVVVELPAVDLGSSAVVPGLSQLSTPLYSVLRYETRLPAGQAIDFIELTQPAHGLMMRVAAKGKYKNPESQGMAATGGFVSGGASGTIVIDPGHGGGDCGCHNRYLGVYEKDVTLDISLRLSKVLQGKGWKVVMTRSDDRDVTYAGSPDAMELEARANVANNIGADLFVSIHCNASVNTGVRGSSVYYYKEQDYDLAQSLDVLGSALGFDELGVLQNRFAVLRMTGMPAALVETAFLTNPREGQMLADPGVRQSIAERLAQGLERYMSRHKPNR